MSRAIKFRAWDKDVERMTVCMTLNQMLEKSPDPFYKMFKDDFVWMQGTGLKDKNGAEIFESDLIDWDGDVYEVRYVSGEWVLWHSGDPNNDRPSLANIIKPSGLNVEVIGNLYQPDLLKETEGK